MDKGTGVAIRARYGITADVAGKTGTTQDNTDGWFILMHPQLVAGAWAGFNDGRITLRSDYWGQGAHSALPMVGDVFRQALRGKIIDARERFIDEEESSWIATATGTLRNWVYDLFGRPTGQQASPAAVPAPEAPRAPVPAASAPPQDERPEITEAPLVPLQEVAPRAPAADPPVWVDQPEAQPAQPYAPPPAMDSAALQPATFNLDR